MNKQQLPISGEKLVLKREYGMVGATATTKEACRRYMPHRGIKKPTTVGFTEVIGGLKGLYAAKESAGL